VSDLSVVLVLDAPQQMSEGNWRVGMFMDDRASDEQAEKLGGIFSGQMGGPLANVVPLISENLGMEVASIEHFDDGLRHRVKVGDAIEMEIEDLVSPFDPDGPLPKLTETKHPATRTLLRPGLSLPRPGPGARLLRRGQERPLHPLLLSGRCVFRFSLNRSRDP
jgi:hypothetical protein